MKTEKTRTKTLGDLRRAHTQEVLTDATTIHEVEQRIGQLEWIRANRNVEDIDQINLEIEQCQRLLNKMRGYEDWIEEYTIEGLRQSAREGRL